MCPVHAQGQCVALTMNQRPDSRNNITPKMCYDKQIRIHKTKLSQVLCRLRWNPTTAPEVSCALFYDQINMADSVTQLFGQNDKQTFIFLRALLAHLYFKQQEKRKYLKPTTTNMNAPSTDIWKKLQRQQPHRPRDRRGLARQNMGLARHSDLLRRSLAKTVFPRLSGRLYG